MARLKKQQYLLSDPDVKRWYNNLRVDSANTGDGYLRRLDYLVRRKKLTPKQMVERCVPEGEKKPDPTIARDFILDLVTEFKAEGKKSSNIHNYVKVLRSWYQHNSITIQGRIKVGKTRLVMVRKENVPEPEELRRILAQAENRRAKVGIAMMAYGGVRPEVLGDADGVDGLKVGDFPEMEYTNEKTQIVTVKGMSSLKVTQRGTVTFTKIPTTFIVRDSLSKMGNEYCGFISKESCDYLKDYLEERMKTQKVFNAETKRREWRPGEQLTPDTPVFPGTKTPFVGKHIQTISVRAAIRRPIRGAGYRWRPYVFRRFYTTSLMFAEYERLVLKDWSVFWMGHGGDIDAVYRTNKGLPPHVKEPMRRAYAAAAAKHLDVMGWHGGVTPESVMDIMNRQHLKLAGYNDKEIEKLNPAKLTAEQVRELSRKKQLGGKGKQKMVPIKDLGKWIEGEAPEWKFVEKLDDKTALIELR